MNATTPDGLAVHGLAGVGLVVSASEHNRSIAALEEQITMLSGKLAASAKLYEMTLDNSGRWMRLHSELEGKMDELQQSLAFAASVIKSGEPWTETCERVIGGALNKDKPNG